MTILDCLFIVMLFTLAIRRKWGLLAALVPTELLVLFAHYADTHPTSPVVHRLNVVIASKAIIEAPVLWFGFIIVFGGLQSILVVKYAEAFRLDARSRMNPSLIAFAERCRLDLALGVISLVCACAFSVAAPMAIDERISAPLSFVPVLLFAVTTPIAVYLARLLAEERNANSRE